MRNLVITFFTVGFFASSAAAQNSQPATDSAAAAFNDNCHYCSRQDRVPRRGNDRIACFTTRVCEKQSDMDKKAADSQRFISGGVNAQLNSGTTP